MPGTWRSVFCLYLPSIPAPISPIRVPSRILHTLCDIGGIVHHISPFNWLSEWSRSGYVTQVMLITEIQYSSVAQWCPTLCNPMGSSTPDLFVLHQLPESTQTHVHWVSDAMQLSHPQCPFLLLSSIFPTIRVFSNESGLCIRWPKYWSFNLSISPSNEYSGLISFRIDWLDLLAVQGTFKSLLQHHSSKASVLWHSAFFMVQLSHPYMTTGKTIALTIWTYVSKVISLLFNTI